MATNNSINTPLITLGGAFTMTGGAFTFTGTLTANTAVTFPTSGVLISSSTYPAAGATAGKIIISDGATWIASTSIWPNTVGTALHIVLSDGTTNVYSTPAYPNASVTAGKVIISDGTNYIASTPTYPNAATTTGSFIYANGTNFVASTSLWPNTVGTVGKIIRSDGTTNAYTTSTFADTYAVSTLLYASSSNVVSGLATGNSGVLVTSAGGVPSIATDIPTAVTIGGAYIYRVGGTDVALADGGTNASLVASNGGIFYSTATAGAILSGTATAGLALLSGATGAPTWSTNKPFTKISTQQFTSGTATYTPTAGTVWALVECWGGGGGGGTTNSAVIPGSGGGSGAYSYKWIQNPSAVTYAVGAAGAGGLMNNGTASTNGGDTTYNATTVIAKGGTGAASAGGGGGAGGQAASGAGDVTFNGGNGSTTPGVAIVYPMPGGSSVRNVPVPNVTGFSFVPNANSGAGGCGGDLTRDAGAGAVGLIIITEYGSA